MSILLFRLQQPFDDECVLWEYLKTPTGYGRISRSKKEQPRGVHRIALEYKLGRPVKPGMETIHSDKCPRNCYNLNHLREGTHAENLNTPTTRAKFSARMMGNQNTKGKTWSWSSARRLAYEKRYGSG